MALLVVGAVVLAGLTGGAILLIGSLRQDRAADLATVRTDFLTYGVPADWARDGEPLDNPLGLEFTGVARGTPYECGGRSYLRGVVASALLPAAPPPSAVATGAARLLASSYYTGRDETPADVTVGAPRTVDVGGIEGTVVEATARAASDDGCLATDGVVLVLAVPVTGPRGERATALLVVNGDTAGGPQSPPMPARATLDAVVASARPGGGS